VSFVAVTQQFNTSTSLGRLTLNILLSFAQFERELISSPPSVRSPLQARRRLLAESHLTRRLFGAMQRRIAVLPVPTG